MWVWGRRSASVSVALLGVGALSAWAHAGNEDEMLAGNEAVLTAGAVTATVSDGSGLLYNPAGLVQVDERSVDVSTTLYGARIYRARLLRTQSGEVATGRPSEVIFVPTAGAYVRRFRPRMAYGLGLFQQRATDLTLQSTLVRPAEPGQLLRTEWQLAVRDSRQVYVAAAGLSWRPHGALRLGASIQGLYDQAFLAGEFLGLESEAGEERSTVSNVEISLVRRLGWRLVAGVQWEASSGWRVGASVQGPAVETAVFADTSGGVTLAGDVSNGELIVAVDSSSEDRLRASIFGPARARLGIARVVGSTQYSVDADVRYGFDSEAIREGGGMAWNVRMGAVRSLGTRWRLGGGLFTDRAVSTPVEAFGDSRVHFYGGTAALQYSSVRWFAPGEEGERMSFVSTFALRYAYGVGDLSSFVVPDRLAGAVLEEVVQVDPFDHRVDEIGLYVGSGLRF